jgi:hypothetical protein
VISQLSCTLIRNEFAWGAVRKTKTIESTVNAKHRKQDAKKHHIFFQHVDIKNEYMSEDLLNLTFQWLENLTEP